MSNIPRHTTDISTGSISNLTAIIYDLRFRFVPPRCVIRWGRRAKGRRGIARFRFRSTGREDPGDNGASPPGVAMTGACGPPPMNPSGPRVRFSRAFTRSHTCGGGRGPLGAGTPRQQPLFISNHRSMQRQTRDSRMDGRYGMRAITGLNSDGALMRSRPEEGSAADGTHD